MHWGQEFPVQTSSWLHFTDNLPLQKQSVLRGYHFSPSQKVRGSCVEWRLRLCTQPGGLEKACLSALGGSRKPFIALTFPARFESRLRAAVFTGPIWRQVFQIKLSSLLSLKDACSFREGRFRPACWFPAAETSTLINVYLSGWTTLLWPPGTSVCSSPTQ